MFATTPYVIVTCSMFFNLEDARYLCTEETCKLAPKKQIPIICVDDSPKNLHETVKEKLESLGEGWVKVSKFRGKGKKGASIRQALKEASAFRQDPSNRWVAIFTELEKVDFMNHIQNCANPILLGEAEIITPARDTGFFRETYATEQYHSESLGNAYLNMSWRKSGGECDLDWLFGPICWEGSSVGPFYLESNEENWDAQVIPSIRATRVINARWKSVQIPYRHHPLQRNQEEGSLEFCEKRLMQLSLMTNLLSRAFNREGRFPVIIVAGAAGNIGKKLTRRLLTTDAGSYLFVPSSSRPSTPALADANIPLTKFKIVLMDCKPCPEDLDISQTNGHEVEYIICDFTKYGSWSKQFQSAYVAFLLAAQNPFPDASPQDAWSSMLINANLLEACASGSVDRVVFASSNHVVGQRLHDPEESVRLIPPNEIPDFGTKYELSNVSMDSTLYASAKVACEAQLKAMVESGRLPRAIILRIGWCQPGENLVSTISVSGTPHYQENKKKFMLDGENEIEERNKILRWFQGMHLKNEDLDIIVDCCIAPGLESSTEDKLIYVNAISDNKNSRWIVNGNKLGYIPT